MKRLITSVLSLFCVLALAGCSNSYKIDDLSQTASIRIRVHSISDNSYVDYVISDKEIIQKTCDLFSSIETKKYKTDQPLGLFYTICFLNQKGNEIESVMVLSNVDNGIWVNSNNIVYKITSNVKIAERIEEILTTHGKAIE